MHTHWHTLSHQSNQPCQRSACFHISPSLLRTDQSPASMLRATEFGSSFLHVWETFALDALSSGICNVSPCVVLHNFISRMHAKTYSADFTGGETKLSSEGTEQNGVIHQCPGLFKQQLQWGSMTVNLGTLGWMPIVQKQRLHTITWKQRASSEPSRAYRGSDSS